MTKTGTEERWHVITQSTIWADRGTDKEHSETAGETPEERKRRQQTGKGQPA